MLVIEYFNTYMCILPVILLYYCVWPTICGRLAFGCSLWSFHQIRAQPLGFIQSSDLNSLGFTCSA